MVRNAGADYGIDAPGVRRGMFVAAVGGACGTLLFWAAASRTVGGLAGAAWLAAALSALFVVYGLGMGAVMTYASKIGKRRACERLLDQAAALERWTGREAVLDVGCGRGLMVVGAARRLTTGQATGVDLWRAEDQSNNGPAAALENAAIEGVADRVRIETGDARVLPYEDAAFDVVVSHWVVHNLPSATDRERALGEMVRVLRPGGTLVLADIAHHPVYKRVLTAAGLAIGHEDIGGAGSRIMGILSAGLFRPRSLVVRKPL